MDSKEGNSHPPDPPPTTKPPLTPEEAARILSAWQLTPAQHTSILHTQILPTELHPFLPPTNKHPSPSPTTRPKAVLILGQTGAGKTRLAPLLLSALTTSSSPPGQTPLHLIADTFKTYHPFYTTCLTTHPHLASRLASREAASWLLSVCTHAASFHIPVLLETACRRQSDFQHLLKAFSNQRYDIRVVVLAVPAALSRLGVMVRYWKRLPEAGSRGLPVRLTPRVVHDESFEGVGEAVGWVGTLLFPFAPTCTATTGDGGNGKERGRGKEGRVERVVVVRRNGGVVYDSATTRVDDEGEGKGKTGEALRALQRERTRGLSEEERRMAEEELTMLRGLGDAKVDKEIAEIEGSIAELQASEDKSPDEVVPFDAVDFLSRSAS